MSQTGEDCFEYWVGIDTPGVGAAELREFNQFYSSTHVPEVMKRYPGMTSCERFELSEPDERGDFGPRWLARYSLSEHGAAHYLAANSDPEIAAPYTEWPLPGHELQIRWRFLWRGLTTDGTSTGTSRAVRLIGMDPARGATDDELTAFNEFYDATHVPEARDFLGSAFATRLALFHDFSASAVGPPRYAAVYELNDHGPAASAARPLSDGPPSWQNRRTHWRLTYALIDRFRRP